MVSYVPAGWPPAVHPPGSEAFEASAVAWLLDVLPPGYREQQRVHRHPVGLAVIARHHTDACVEGTRQGYRTIRTELRACLSADEIDAVLATYRTEGAKLAATARAAVLVERAPQATSRWSHSESSPHGVGTVVAACMSRVTELVNPSGDWGIR